MAQVTIDRELLERIDESAICDGTDATISDDLFTQLVAALAAPRQPAEVGELAERMKDAERNEKHWNVQQTRYWCNQYKLLARAALAKLGGK